MFRSAKTIVRQPLQNFQNTEKYGTLYLLLFLNFYNGGLLMVFQTETCSHA